MYWRLVGLIALSYLICLGEVRLLLPVVVIVARRFPRMRRSDLGRVVLKAHARGSLLGLSALVALLCTAWLVTFLLAMPEVANALFSW